MTLSDFKSWLEGFSEAMGDAPTPEQWAKIKAKLAQVRQPQTYAPNPIPMPRVPSFYEIDKTPRDPMWGLPTVTCGGITARGDGVLVNRQPEVRQ